MLKFQSTAIALLAQNLWLGGESGMTKLSAAVAKVVIVMALVMSFQAFAQEGASSAVLVEEGTAGNGNIETTAHSVVESTTVDLLTLIQDAKTYVDEDEARFNKELEALLAPFVDFRSFARAVMGKYASKSTMASLDDAQQAQLEQQITGFSEVFSKALIVTYGKGLLAFEGERIEVVAADEKANAKPNKAKVKQLIYGERAKPFEILYSMRKNADGEWKLRNMVIESINLGIVYRNQFYNAYDVYEGDMNRVIANWSVATTNR